MSAELTPSAQRLRPCQDGTMKQFAFMLITSFLGTAGSFGISPVLGIAIYYLYAVLRPSAAWFYAEAFGYTIGDFNWSLPVALCTLGTTLVWRLGIWTPLAVTKPPPYGNPKFDRSHYLFLAFTAWISLTALTAIKPDVAWPYFIEYLKIFVMFICATLVLRTARDLWIIYLVVLCSAAYIAYEQNLIYLEYGKSPLQKNGYGGLDNNGAALIMAMAIPMAYFAWESTRRWWRWGYMMMIPVLGHVILLSYSRGAMLSLIPTAILMWVRSRHKGFLTVAYAIAVVLILATTSKEIGDRFVSIGSDETNPRLTSWRIAIQMANERPIFGFGIRNSNLYTFDYGADEVGRTIHSQYLQIAADSGWVALAIYLGLIASIFVGLWRTRWVLRKFTDPETLHVRSLTAGVESALLLFCFGAIFLSLEHFEMPYIIMLLGVQVHAITRAAMAKMNPTPSGLPPLTLPYPYPAPKRPVTVPS
jgi:probable O-glycosylation ligase (exosortase A-associated)